MVLRRDQAVQAIMQSLNLGYPAFMVQGYIERIAQHLYGQSVGIALRPVEQDYQEISAQEAYGLVFAAARAVGLNPTGQEQKIMSGLNAMSGKGYVFVRRVR